MTSLPQLNILLQIIIESYFFKARCLVMFGETAKKIELRTEIPLVRLDIANDTLFRHQGCQDIIIYTANPTDTFTKFEHLIRTHNERFNLRRYVIVSENATEIFNTKEATYVSDVLIIVPNGNRYDLAIDSHGTTLIIDSWFRDNCSFLYGNNLFPDKLKNQMGQPLKIGTFTYEPYSVVSADHKTFKGTEANLVFEFVKQYNLTPVFKVIGEDLWGDIYPNWTGVGVLGSLLNDEVDIGYAAIYTWEEYYNYLDYSKPFTRTGITCLVPAPKLAAGWLTPLYSFSPQMWVALGLVFISSTITLTFLSKNQSFDKSLSTMVRMYLLQSIRLPTNVNLIKYFIGLNLISVLLLSSCYSSGLATVMTIPRYERAVKTVKDLASSGLNWGAPTDAWLISLRHVDQNDYKTIKKRFVVKNEKDLEIVSRLHNFGFSLERLPYGHYAVGPYVKRDVISDYRIMPQDIYWEQCIFMVRKNSILLPLLDNLILRVFEAGLGAYWESQVVGQYMDMVVQRGIKYYTRHIREHETVKLQWFHVEGAFAILILGYLASIVILFCEFLLDCRRNK